MSLHGDVFWASQVTAENAANTDMVLPEGLDRAVWKWTPTEFTDGRRSAFSIGVFRYALLRQPHDPKDAVIEVENRWDALTVTTVWMTEPGVEPYPDWSVVAGPMLLANGRAVWVTKHWEQLAQAQPEALAVRAMVEPVGPDTHPVTGLGWFVRGVHVR